MGHRWRSHTVRVAAYPVDCVPIEAMLGNLTGPHIAGLHLARSHPAHHFLHRNTLHPRQHRVWWFTTAKGIAKVTKKLFNFRAMGTSAKALMLMDLRHGRGSLPEGVNWAATPHGEKFWEKAFVYGKGQGKRAITRLLRQASDDLYQEVKLTGRLAPKGD